MRTPKLMHSILYGVGPMGQDKAAQARWPGTDAWLKSPQGYALVCSLLVGMVLFIGTMVGIVLLMANGQSAPSSAFVQGGLGAALLASTIWILRLQMKDEAQRLERRHERELATARATRTESKAA